jgi:hypothetical protein
MAIIDFWWTFNFCMIKELLKANIKSILKNFHYVLSKNLVGGRKMWLLTIEPYDSQLHSNLTLKARHNLFRNSMIGMLNLFHFLLNDLEIFAAQSWNVCRVGLVNIAVVSDSTKQDFPSKLGKSFPLLRLVWVSQTLSGFGTLCGSYPLPTYLSELFHKTQLINRLLVTIMS